MSLCLQLDLYLLVLLCDFAQLLWRKVYKLAFLSSLGDWSQISAIKKKDVYPQKDYYNS